MARKMCRTPLIHFYDFSGAWDSPLECCIASSTNSNVKASQTDLSRVLESNQGRHIISACAYDDLVDKIRSSSAESLAGHGTHEKVTKHAKRRRTDGRSRSKHSPVVQMIAEALACVPWMCVEQQVALFQHQLSRRKSVSICLSKKNSSLGRGEWWLMLATKRGF